MIEISHHETVPADKSQYGDSVASLDIGSGALWKGKGGAMSSVIRVSCVSCGGIAVRPVVSFVS